MIIIISRHLDFSSIVHVKIDRIVEHELNLKLYESTSLCIAEVILQIYNTLLVQYAKQKHLKISHFEKVCVPKSLFCLVFGTESCQK